MALSKTEQVQYILNPELRKKIKEMSFRIEEAMRHTWNQKYEGLNTTDIYRKLTREILKINGSMEIRDLFRAITETKRISDDIILSFFISNLFLDPNPQEPLEMYQEGNKTFIALRK